MEDRDEGMSSAWFMLGGLVVGTVAGLLLAPKAGVETREDIEEWSRDKREKAQSLISRVSEAIPFRVKAAAAGGAIKSGVSEASNVASEKAKQFLGS